MSITSQSPSIWMHSVTHHCACSKISLAGYIMPTKKSNESRSTQFCTLCNSQPPAEKELLVKRTIEIVWRENVELLHTCHFKWLFQYHCHQWYISQPTWFWTFSNWLGHSNSFYRASYRAKTSHNQCLTTFLSAPFSRCWPRTPHFCPLGPKFLDENFLLAILNQSYFLWKCDLFCQKSIFLPQTIFW